MRNNKFSLDVLGPSLIVAGELDLGDHSVAVDAADGLLEHSLVLLGNLAVFQSLERDEAQGLGAGWGGLISVAGGQSDFLEAEQKSAVVGHLKLYAHIGKK